MPPKGRVIHHDDDDDGDDDMQLFHTVRTESKGLKRASSISSTTATRTASKSSVISRQSSTGANVSNLSGKQEPENLIGDDEVQPPIPSANSAEDSTLAKKRKRDQEFDEDFLLDDNPTNTEALQQDETFQKLLQLKQRVNQVKNKPQLDIPASSSASVSAKGTSSKTTTRNTESTVVIPQVLTAAERQQLVEQQFAQQQLLQQQKQKALQPASTMEDDRDEDEDDDAAITIKTRLATANHEKTWKFNPDKPFEKLKAKIAKLYGVSPSILVMKFDGEKLQDEDTPTNAGIEDEDLLDVQITDKKKLDKVVDSLGSKRTK